MTLDPISLTASLDHINSAAFYDQELELNERRDLARWLGQRQGLAGPSSATFSPTALDQEQTGRTWTGERLSASAQRYVWSMESCRAMVLLDSPEEAPRDSLRKVTTHLRAQLRRAPAPGFFRSGPVSVALWRLATVGGVDRREERLEDALHQLAWRERDNRHWRAFPLYYSLSALLEMEIDGTQAALRHAAPVCERALKRRSQGTEIDLRRKAIAERVLARV